MKGLQNLLKIIVSSRDVRTSRKLLAFVSDDWGCVRIRSKADRKALLGAGFKLETNRFDKFDMLESNDDMERLLELISRFKDVAGNPFVITAVSNMGNPDFDAIRRSGFASYSYKTLVQSWNEAENSNRVHSLVLEGIKNGIFRPEFHGREHVFVSYWMELLKAEHPIVKKAFEYGYYMLGRESLGSNYLFGLGAAFDFDSRYNLKNQADIIADGLKIFADAFAFRSSYFTPPALLYNNQLNAILKAGGINYVDVSRNRKMPVGNGKYTRRFHYLGQSNGFNQRYVTRNCVFEPNQISATTAVDSCLKDIRVAFESKRPAIISNHRVAFVSGLCSKNGVTGLKALELLIKSILSKWPDVEFCTVPDLMNKMTVR